MSTLVQSITPADAVASNPTSAAFSAALTVGSRIVAAVVTDHLGGTGAVTAVSGGGVTTWAKDVDQGSASPVSISMEIWSGVVTSSVTTGVSFTWSTTNNSHIWWFIQEWANLGAFDKVSSIATGSGTAALSGSTGVLAQADSTVFGLFEWRTTAATTATLGAGYSGLIQGSNTNASSIMGGALESQNVSATTSITAAVTLSPTNQWGALAAAYKNLSLGAAGPVTPPVMGGMTAAVARASTW